MIESVCTCAKRKSVDRSGLEIRASACKSSCGRLYGGIFSACVSVSGVYLSFGDYGMFGQKRGRRLIRVVGMDRLDVPQMRGREEDRDRGTAVSMCNND